MREGTGARHDRLRPSPPSRSGFLLGVFLLGLAACAKPAEKKHRDIVSLAPAASCTLAALGLADRLAGVTTDDPTCPPGCQRLGRIGALDSENLLALEPAVVIATGSGEMGLDPAVRAQASRFRVLLQDNPRTVDEAFAQVVAVGAAAGEEAAAQKAVAGAKAQMEALEAGQPRHTALRVLLVGSLSPQIGAYGPGYVHDELLRRLGAQNALPAASPGWVTLDREAVVKLAPDAVVWISAEVGGGTDALLAEAFKDLPIPAVTNHRVKHVGDPLALLPSLNLPQVERALAEAIHAP